MKNNILKILFILIVFCSCQNDDDEINKKPSIENNFLGKDYLQYTVNGKTEFEYGNYITFNLKRHYIDNDDILVSGPNEISFPNRSIDFKATYFSWIPVQDSIIKNIELPYKNKIMHINFPEERRDLNLLFGFRFSLSSWYWAYMHDDKFDDKNYNIINQIILIDSSDLKINRYKVSGEFKTQLKSLEKNDTIDVFGKYRYEIQTYK